MNGIIYYTDNKFREPMFSVAQEYIKKANLPITSSSLNKVIDFGDNEVINRPRRGFVTMIIQILSCLKRSKAKYVFFCEHDVLYHRSHFDFVPPRDDTYYYNANCWRWYVGSNHAIKHHGMISLSGMCANRELALNHYQAKINKMKEKRWDKDESRNPFFGRKWGFEPGRKPMRLGGFSNERHDVWESEYPLIDIRHRLSFSGEKTKKSDFKHEPKWWKKIPVEEIQGWNIRKMFDETIFNNYTRDKSKGWKS
jgi:hypothetical protein